MLNSILTHVRVFQQDSILAITTFQYTKYIITNRTITKGFKEGYNYGSSDNNIESKKKLSAVLSNHATLNRIPTEELQRRINTLLKNKIEFNVLEKNPWLLDFRSKEITAKLNLLKNLPLEDEAKIRLLGKTITEVNQFVKVYYTDTEKNNFKNRMHYMSKKLSIKQDKLCEYISKYPFLKRLSLIRIMNVMDVLLGHGMSPAHILKDPWIFKYKPNDINARLIRAKNAEVEVLKPWMGRCPEKIFERLLQRTTAKQDLLGSQSVEEYISQRLECSVERVKFILQRNPNISKMNVWKIKQMLDFLYCNGFDSNQIIWGLAKIVKRRVDTINVRLTELRQLGLDPKNLNTLCKSKKEYSEFIKRVKELNKNASIRSNNLNEDL